MMQSVVAKESRRKKSTESIQNAEPTALQNEPVHSQPVSPRNDIQARITDRAYKLYAEHGYRQGYALDDWLEAEREILGLERKA
jgi:hypothetical protein